MPIYETPVMREAKELIVNIPMAVQPIRRRIPGKRARYVETREPIQFETGTLSKDGRIRIITPIHILERFGIDPYIRIALQVGPYWLPSHLYHNVPSGGVLVPKKIVEEVNVKPNDVFSGKIAGVTYAVKPMEIGEITVYHLNRSYVVQERQWVLPYDTGHDLTGLVISPENIFGLFIDQNYSINAKWYYTTPGEVTVDFIVSSVLAEREIIRKNNYAYRKMSVINYQANKNAKKQSIYFFCENRAWFITAYPQGNYLVILPNGDEQPKDMTLTTSLDITTKNMQNWHPFLSNVHLGLRTKSKGEAREPPLDVQEIHGLEDERISAGEVDINSYVQKHVRFVDGKETNYYNEPYNDGKREVPGIEDNIGNKLWVDRSGFVWRKFW